MIHLKELSDCCGCTACAAICPHEAIRMEPDVLGFLYPQVDEQKCVECGLCERVCAFRNDYDRSNNLPMPEAYAARHKDPDEIMRSRSGAVFAALSDQVLAQGGVVYGAGYEGHFRVIHKRAVTKEERDEMRGSKYVQSDLRDALRSVKRDLEAGRLVLFSGTPCQTAALNSYVGKRLRPHLLLTDIVCHGVPAPYIWRDYLAYLEKMLNDRIIAVDFRDKRQSGWTAHHESFQFERMGYLSFKLFTQLFFQDIMLRHSCGKCPFANLHRPSDLTLADFWGWEHTDPNFNKDDKGCSLILINTTKGRTLFEAARKDLHTLRAEVKNCLQPNLQHPSTISERRMEFETDYAEKGFAYAAQKQKVMKRTFGLKLLLLRARQALHLRQLIVRT